MGYVQSIKSEKKFTGGIVNLEFSSAEATPAGWPAEPYDDVLVVLAPYV